MESSPEFRGTKPVPCQGLSAATLARIGEVAETAFAAMELRDYARLDVRLSADGTPYIIDVNPNCDLSDLAGGFSKAAKAGGLAYENVIVRLVELALSRRHNADTIPLTKRSKSAERAVGTGNGEPVSTGRSVMRARAPRGGA